MTASVEIWTDGACRGNPGPGGWGVVLRAPGRETHLWGGDPQTTNNRMELTAAIRALRRLRRRCVVVLHTDSKYVIRGIEDWMPGWKRKGWLNSKRQPIVSADLWRELDAARNAHEVTWKWVKGHSGDPDNELADLLANRGIDEFAARGVVDDAEAICRDDSRRRETH
ncbi:MAG TPA: ribonuclease HI [Pseudomonadales bacterium]|nr:ribonuclease HI [Pseudomonadales bacterium]